MKRDFLLKGLMIPTLMLMGSINMLAKDAYAAISSDKRTLTFYYDDNKISRKGMGLDPADGFLMIYWHHLCDDRLQSKHVF